MSKIYSCYSSFTFYRECAKSAECVTSQRCHLQSLQQHYIQQRTKRLNLHGNMSTSTEGFTPDKKIKSWRSPRRSSERSSPQKRTSSPIKQPTSAINGKGKTPRKGFLKRKHLPLRRSPRKHLSQASLSQIVSTKRQKLSDCKGLYLLLVLRRFCFHVFH